jgi:hypothetical protein
MSMHLEIGHKKQVNNKKSKKTAPSFTPIP